MLGSHLVALFWEAAKVLGYGPYLGKADPKEQALEGWRLAPTSCSLWCE